MFISFFCTKSDSQMSEAPSILKGLLMTSKKTFMPPSTPVLISLDGMLTKIKSNIYTLHNLDLPPSLF